jgi:PPOX class probable F420-dependent enzyme
MSEDEVAAFLAGRHSMSVATNGPDGYPHLVAMWYGFLDGAPAIWTYAKSQKVQNLRRDDRITCLIEDGDNYQELQGLMLVGRGVIIDDMAQKMAVGKSLYERYTGPLTAESQADLERNARKRVVIRIEVERVMSWDHRKLAA